MSLVFKQQTLMLSFEGRSPRQIYLDECAKLGCHPQKHLIEELSNNPNDFGKLQHLLCALISFGVRGCLALVPILQFSRYLRRIDLKGCGITDEFVAHLVEAMQEHQYIRTMDLSDNPFITVHSGKGLVKLCEVNQNIVACVLDKTHIGANVAKVVHSRCQANHLRLLSYFADDYFRMKDLFNVLDADGSGWVHVKNIIGSVGSPILQERLIERIAIKRPKKRQDNCIHVNTFLELVYLNYKTLLEINERCQETVDPVALTVKMNWKLLLKALQLRDVTCSQLTKFRVRDMTLSQVEASDLVDAAIQMSVKRAEATAAANNEAGKSSTAMDQQLDVDVRDLTKAYRAMFPPLPSVPRVYGFLKERAEDYVSPLLRNGSRCVSITDVSSNATPALSMLGEDDDDPPHTWKLPPSMVRAVVGLFVDQKDLVIDQLLDGTPSTELEYLRLSGLCGMFAQYSIPTDISTISVQEVVNLLDEYYDVVRVDKVFTIDQIDDMCN